MSEIQLQNWICVYGDSHVTCFRSVGEKLSPLQGRAQQEPTPDNVTANEKHWWFFAKSFAPAKIIDELVLTDNAGRRILNPLMTNAFCSGHGFEGGDWSSPGVRRPGSLLALCLGGNVAYRLTGSKLWNEVDFVVPGHEDLPFDKTRRLLPFSLVAEIFGEKMRLIGEAFELMKNEYSGAYALVLGPPPHPDNDYIKRSIEIKRHIRPEDRFMLSPVVRLKMWLAARYELMKVAQDTGVLLIPEPPNTYDKEGFLCEEYWDDGFHANSTYGELMKRHILELASNFFDQQGTAGLPVSQPARRPGS
jgi:hypothetical protein